MTSLFARALRWAACVLAVPLLASAAAPPKDAPRGAVLYHNYCSVCHGDKGDGRSRATGSLSTPPRDFTTEASRRELSRERIVLAITHGRPGTAMVGWQTQLSEADIGVLADHVLATYVNRETGAPAPAATAGISGTRAHGGREADTASTPVQVDMTAGLPNGLKGDFKRGGAFYLANCATCHSTSVKFTQATSGFNHTRTAFPLTGAHTTVACASCHANKVYKPVAFESCASCHKSPHQPPLPGACSSCHTTGAWRTTKVDHARTAFPLRGKHATVACAQCHVKPALAVKPKSDTCASCHTDPHKGSFKQDCSACHSETSFQKGAFDHATT